MEEKFANRTNVKETLYSEYIKITQNLTLRKQTTQLNNGQRLEQILYQKGYRDG